MQSGLSIVEYAPFSSCLFQDFRRRLSYAATVDFPTIVNQALELFGEVFDKEPARRHFAEYLTGLMVAERKNISAINRQFAVTTDQSCLNRWLVEAAWDATALNDCRLAWLQDNPKTRYSPHGVIAIDNTLVDHSGKLIEDVGWLWDHAQQRHVIAHDYLISNYVCPSGSHYPIEWRRFRKKDSCPSVADIKRVFEGPIVNVKRMTWEGHEFLDAARKDTLWDRAKEKTLKATGGLSLDVLKGVLIELGKQALEGPS